jgi:hypothetical protein
MSDGFRVDLPALEQASAGINMTLEDLTLAVTVSTARRRPSRRTPEP